MLLDFRGMGRPLQCTLVAIGTVVSMFLLLPVVFIVALSFGNSQWLVFPPPGWTLQWYRELLADPAWLEAAFTSLRIGLIVTGLSVVLGYLSAEALVRGRFKGNAWLQALFLAPMVLPVVVVAVALYALFLRLGLTGTLFGFIAGHLVIALPFSVIAIGNALRSFDPALEDAARICGADEFTVKWRVTLPNIRLGLGAAAVFSFLVSWDEVVISIFMSAPGVETLPVRIWSALRQDLSPVIAAASALLIGLTLVLMVLAAALQKKER